MDSSQAKIAGLIGIGVGVAAVAVTGVCVKIFLTKKEMDKLLKDATVKYSVELIDREELSHDTRRFRFRLNDKKQVLGLPVGQHIYLSAKINGSLVVRPYTPVSCERDQGYFDLVIKVYKSNVHPKFPDGGKMTQFMDGMNIGDCIDVRGPSGNLIYKGGDVFSIRKEKKSDWVDKKYKTIGMIAGGSGITPMLQLIREVLYNKNDTVKMWLVYANQTEDDILLRDELDDLARQHPGRLRVYYTLDRPSDSWNYGKGFITEEMCRQYLPAAGDDTLVVCCGPPPMMQFACSPSLDKCGHSTECIFIY